MKRFSKSLDSKFPKIILKSVSNIIVFGGFLYLIKIIVNGFDGTLASEMVNKKQVTFSYHILALALNLPIPFHIISVGLIFQKRWLSLKFNRILWIALIISGTWLGIAIVVKLFI